MRRGCNVIAFELNPDQRELGQALDLVLALEEWSRVEFEFTAAAFKPGAAALGDDRSWVWGGLLVLHMAF